MRAARSFLDDLRELGVAICPEHEAKFLAETATVLHLTRSTTLKLAADHLDGIAKHSDALEERGEARTFRDAARAVWALKEPNPKGGKT
jgi:hypothetical protein